MAWYAEACPSCSLMRDCVCARLPCMKGWSCFGHGHMCVCGVKVFGCLTAERTVHEEQMRALVERSRPLRVTFHRAFDQCRDMHEALTCVQTLGEMCKTRASRGPVDE